MVTTVDVKDAAGTTRTVNTLPALGQAAATASLPAALAAEHFAPQQLAASLAVAFPRKLSITGTTISSTTTNNNLLDGAGTGLWTDVRDYNTLLLIMVSTATTGSYIAEGSFDSSGTIGVTTLQVQVTTLANGASMINGAVTPSSGVVVGRINVADFNYVRIRLSTGPTTGSITAYGVVTQAVVIPPNVNVMQSTGSNLHVQVDTLTGGAVAEDAATSSNPLIVGGVVRTSTGPTTLIAGDAARHTMTTGGALVSKPFASTGADWAYNGILTTTTAQPAKAAGSAGIKNCVTGFQYQNTNATATEIQILDNATVIWRGYALANMAAPATVMFQTPLVGSAATALNVNCGTTGANVYMNVQGYQTA